ncbi:MAG TPA: histidinol-phosphate transaminase [Vicinamibacterales bacterium]|jgi:histidinol-phosphate aminotransferase|nr:histidinol-phosphate transaminase [Vicinamibacterales bacterium]
MIRTGYLRPPAETGVLRLHLNENTGGCSPAALSVIRGLSAGDLGRYPDYQQAIAEVARVFRVPADYVLLTNGLDEGILAATAAAFRRRDGFVPEAIGVRPAFDMYDTTVDGLGGRMRTVPLDPQFQWSASSLLAVVSAATRIIFVTNPHNPSGCCVPLSEILELAAQSRPAVVFVDEAYADFTHDTLLDPDVLRSMPNIVVGRTFSKAYGLAGLRIGALVASPETLQPMRKIVPPYSVNAVAAAALPAALADSEYTSRYVKEACQSRDLIEDACGRLGVAVVPSAANFVLVRAGAVASALADALARRGIAVRDRSREPGCEGCLRVTAGRITDTRRFVAALEDAWRELQR